jgi:8-oxo-dGTP pyrophosphatase MutT (NUDIX family)
MMSAVDHRALIRASVLAREPVDAREEASLTAFIEHFDRLVDPCNEHADDVHVTASAILVGRRGVVLHLHKRLQKWLQPGGHIDAGELPWAAALREASEETGLEVELAQVAPPESAPALAHVDVHPGPRGHTHLDLRYIVVGADADPDPPAGESQQVRWFSWDDAVEIADPGLVGALIAARHEHEQPA